MEQMISHVSRVGLSKRRNAIRPVSGSQPYLETSLATKRKAVRKAPSRKTAPAPPPAPRRSRRFPRASGSTPRPRRPRASTCPSSRRAGSWSSIATRLSDRRSTAAHPVPCDGRVRRERPALHRAQRRADLQSSTRRVAAGVLPQQKEIDYYWDKLGEGGDRTRANAAGSRTSTGSRGRSCRPAWPDISRTRSRRATERAFAAMMRMKKIDIAGAGNGLRGERVMRIPSMIPIGA